MPCEPRRYSFFVFVAITSVLLDIGCLILYKVARQRMDPKYFTATYLPMAEMLLSFLWSVFWLAASVTFAAQLPLAKQLPGTTASGPGGAPSRALRSSGEELIMVALGGRAGRVQRWRGVGGRGLWVCDLHLVAVYVGAGVHPLPECPDVHRPAAVLVGGADRDTADRLGSGTPASLVPLAGHSAR